MSFQQAQGPESQQSRGGECHGQLRQDNNAWWGARMAGQGAPDCTQSQARHQTGHLTCRIRLAVARGIIVASSANPQWGREQGQALGTHQESPGALASKCGDSIPPAQPRPAHDLLHTPHSLHLGLLARCRLLPPVRGQPCVCVQEDLGTHVKDWASCGR